MVLLKRLATFLTLTSVVVVAAEDPWLVDGINANGSDPTLLELQTGYGMLKGKYYATENGRDVFAFLGVPYATPPVYDLRFEPPRPPKAWDGVRDATFKRADCLQLSHMKQMQRAEETIVGDEDCLYMNIYTPQVYNRILDQPPRLVYKPRLPVVVFFHGGAFSYGSGNEYEPKYILDRMDVVFITVNYRLGPFGFLSTESVVVSGNMGLKDQVQALHWIQDNVRLFGGDKDKVTLIGFSAGAASVHFHYLSKRSMDLFSRGMSMSGSALCPWALTDKARQKYRALTFHLACTDENDAERVACLKVKPGRDILLETKRLFHAFLYNPFTAFGPVIEKAESGWNDTFLDQNPYDVLRSGRAKNAPWMVSGAIHDGLYPGAEFLLDPAINSSVESDWEKLAPHIFDYNYTVLPDLQPSVSAAIKDRYTRFMIRDFGSPEKFAFVVENALTDRLYHAYTAMAAKIQSYAQTENVYYYYFAYSGRDSYSRIFSGKNFNPGVVGEDQLIYMFGSPLSPLEKPSTDYTMLEYMFGVWKNFIFDGRPEKNPYLDENYQSSVVRPRLNWTASWKPVDKDIIFGELNFMKIDSPNETKMTRWDDFGNQNFWFSLNIDELLFLKGWRYYSYRSSEDYD